MIKLIKTDADYSRWNLQCMKKMYLLFGIALVALTSCGGGNHERLGAAMQVLDAKPDSAYVILKNVDYNSLSDRDKADYALTRAEANMAMGRSLVADTLLPQAIAFYREAGDTASYVDAAVAQAMHLRSVERKDEAFAFIDSISAGMPVGLRRELNQELLGFTFMDKDFRKSLEIIERQIALAGSGAERYEFEIKKIVPLNSLGRSREAVWLCDSLFALPDAPAVGSERWLYMRMNYASALGERRATAPQAVEVYEDIIRRMNDAPDSKLVELYIPMANLCMNAGRSDEADRYLRMIDSIGADVYEQDAVTAFYVEILRMVRSYDTDGTLSIGRISDMAHSLRKVTTERDAKRQERDDALEAAYDLSRNNYELTIRNQRMWLAVILVLFLGLIAVISFAYVSRRRREKLLAAENRIETLEELLKSASSPSTDKKQGLLKRLLLQQIGIIKTFAESPTAQNQDALRKISNIGNSATPIDSLVRWDDVFPVIDELYDGFHENLLKTHPGLFSEREIQIICLIRAGFSTKEIGVLLQQTPNSIYVSKTAIRKKLGLQPKEDFMSVLTA